MAGKVLIFLDDYDDFFWFLMLDCCLYYIYIYCKEKPKKAVVYHEIAQILLVGESGVAKKAYTIDILVMNFMNPL